jgi:ligand-binding sensor domain-containing protein
MEPKARFSLVVSAVLYFLFGGDSDKKKDSDTIVPVAEAQNPKENKVLKPENGFNSSYLDSAGVLWFGSNGGGVYRYDGTSFTHFTEENGLSDNQVFSITEDSNGMLWLGTQNGLCKYDGTTFTHVPIPFSDTSGVWLDKVYPVLNPNAIHSLMLDRKGNLWIGTGGAGAYRYDGKTFTSFQSEIGRKQEDSLYHNWVPSMTEDAQGNIWFASMTHGGASKYDGESFTHFLIEDGLTDDMVRVVYEDKSGSIWFGFNGNRESGLTYYDGESMMSFYEKDGLCSKSIISIFEDNAGNLWLGGDRGNLCIFDGTTFSEFTSAEGQNFAGVLVITQDTQGNIWFGSRNGLWKFDGVIVTEMTV